LQRLLASLPDDLRVVNLINLETRASRQILVHARVVDVDRNAAKDLGVSWGSLVTQDVRTMQSSTFQPQPILFGQMPAAGFFGSALGGGGLKRVLPLAAQLNALITENKARVLSEPSLLVRDGGEGHILVGGEIPIPVAQNNNGTGSASVTVEYKPYGVKLDCKAAIVGDHAVLLTVSPEVSALDYGNLIQVNGFTIPALTVRRATTTLQMQDGQTLLIGGLYSNESTRQVQRIPLLSQIPVLGEFFKNTLTRKQESELLILIEPEIVTAATAGVQPPPPGSLENLPIHKPDVERRAFDRDFPALTPSPPDKREAPKTPVNLPEKTP
jgi:pilus assembly protein CpaC